MNTLSDKNSGGLPCDGCCTYSPFYILIMTDTRDVALCPTCIKTAHDLCNTISAALTSPADGTSPSTDASSNDPTSSPSQTGK